MSRPMEVGEIAAELGARLGKLARELLPHGRRDGAEWVEARRAQGGMGDSLRINVEKRVWKHFATGDAGDALDLVAYLVTKGDKVAAIKWARSWLGIDSGDHARTAERQPVTPPPASSSDDTTARRRELARGIFFGARDVLRGTPADIYLKGRGLDLERLARQPRALRYDPALYNRESDRKWPALVAAISNPAGDVVAVHRTWLEVHRNGRTTKAPLQDAKMTLGSYAGGAIRLWRGASGRNLKEAPAGERVMIAEGIEDGLSAVCAKPELRCLVAVSLSNMAAIALPEAVTEIIIIGQNDPPDSPAARSLVKVIKAFHGQGRTVRLATMPAGTKDINELWQAELEPEPV